MTSEQSPRKKSEDSIINGRKRKDDNLYSPN
jgi:hypothetical protein